MANGKKPIILIVDDSADFTEIMKAKLDGAGYQTVTAADGEEGLKKMKTIKPDLVLMDVEMPVMNGAEAVAKMQEDEELRGIKVVFLTSYGDPTESSKWLDDKFAREAGAVDYVRKTDSLSEILESIRHFTRGEQG